MLCHGYGVLPAVFVLYGIEGFKESHADELFPCYIAVVNKYGQFLRVSAPGKIIRHISFFGTLGPDFRQLQHLHRYRPGLCIVRAAAIVIRNQHDVAELFQVVQVGFGKLYFLLCPGVAGGSQQSVTYHGVGALFAFHNIKAVVRVGPLQQVQVVQVVAVGRFFKNGFAAFVYITEPEVLTAVCILNTVFPVSYRAVRVFVHMVVFFRYFRHFFFDNFRFDA